MSLIRWKPFAEIDGLQREINSLFDSVVPTNLDITNPGFVPAAEISETLDTVYLKLEVPGLDVKDIDIKVAPQSIAVVGERKIENKIASDGMVRSEFRYGSFRRVISLPARVKNTQVKAEYKDGILNLSLPKAEEEKNQVVKVNLS